MFKLFFFNFEIKLKKKRFKNTIFYNNFEIQKGIVKIIINILNCDNI